MRHFRVPIAKALIVTLVLSMCVPLVAPAWADGPRQMNEDQSPDPRELNAGDPDGSGGSGALFLPPDLGPSLDQPFWLQTQLILRVTRAVLWVRIQEATSAARPTPTAAKSRRRQR